MQDLAAPSSKPAPKPAPIVAPAPTPVSKPAPAPVPSRATSVNIDTDDLDALMASLNNSSSRESVKVSTPTPAPYAVPAHPPAPAPATVQPAPKSNPQPQPSKAPTMDDLDELLNGLEPSRASVGPARASVYVQPPPAAAPVSPAQKPISKPAAATPRASAPPAKPAARPLAGDDLDNLLSNLTSQMNDIDSSNPASRGTCAQCRKPILGEVIQALGKTFHPEHFVCGNCQNPLGTNNFYEQDGLPHCERCYQELFCSRCAHCDEPILDRCITALGKKWHLHHFVCTQCMKSFDNGSFFERDQRPYCEGCFYNVYASRCAGCNQAIRGECINALGQQWHPEHFVCQYCQKSFAGGSFFEFGGKPYCEVHYHQQTGSLCAGCWTAITGRCVNALDKKWHPEHFVCAFCMNPLAGGSFTENNGKAYCKECHSKLF